MDEIMNEEKIKKTLDYIEKDRIVAEDPFFHTRLMARAEDYFSTTERRSGQGTVWIRLRPVIAGIVVVIGIFAGIFSGSRLSSLNRQNPEQARSEQLQQYSEESYINEINGSIEEQLLSK